MPALRSLNNRIQQRKPPLINVCSYFWALAYRYYALEARHHSILAPAMPGQKARPCMCPCMCPYAAMSGQNTHPCLCLCLLYACLKCAVRTMFLAPCALCRVPYALCHVPCAVCLVQCAVCCVPCAVYHVPCALCLVSCTLQPLGTPL